MKRPLSSCSVLALLFVPACGGDKPAAPAKSPSDAAPSQKPSRAAKKPARPVRLDMVLVNALWGSEPASPEMDNPSTPEKVALGRMLAVTAKNLAYALGAFQRTLVTKSRFDKFLDGDSRALSNEEKLGFKTFMDVGCQTCHLSRLVGGSMQQKLGVYGSHANAEDIGHGAVSGDELTNYFFKVPSLLNVEKTAPYNHDGASATLEEVVKEMGSIQLDKTLTGELPAEIVAPK